MILLPILYENEEILIIDKPSGLAVQGGSGIKHSVDTLLPQQTGYPVFLVHRLDKDTSGILIAAKSSVFAAKWTRLIASKEVKKEYEAFCIGCMDSEDGYIDEIIEQKGVDKEARTFYKVKALYEMSYEDETGIEQKQIFSLIRLQLDTGRMHQIRIHLARRNCPVASDDKHGNFKLNKEIKKRIGISKLMLHAKKVQIPLKNELITFETDYPPHMKDLSFSGKIVKLR